MDAPPSNAASELLLLVGGGVVTIAIATFAIVMLVRANRDHVRELEREARARADRAPASESAQPSASERGS